MVSITGPLCFGNKKRFNGDSKICKGCKFMISCEEVILSGNGYIKSYRRTTEKIKIKRLVDDTIRLVSNNWS